ncbi:hypothetical protein [Absidia glauca]|uniref:WD repeat-containing protein JIP5 n=1 Tax=Absidia glauca TaxID=4829 RepID=A0A163M6D5_ABSGL|nr:hypothetical protein [Absidia glauca]
MSKAPDPIPFTDAIFDFCFHPTQQLVVAGLITGSLYWLSISHHSYRYTTEENSLLWSTQVSKKSCRGVEFNPDGSVLMSISRDKSIQTLDSSTGRLLMKIPKAHRYPINKIQALDLNRIATGDDEGIIKIWDMRTPPTVAQQYTVHDDFISDMTFNQGKSTLVAAGGDGVLSIHDTRKLDKKVATCVLDDELLTLTTIKNEEQVVAGSQSGALYFWQWGEWTTVKDRWLGHPCSVDTLCQLDQDTLCTGGNDGLLRLVSVSPHYKFEGILGDHGEDFPVERVRLSNQGGDASLALLGSCGHDLNLRFWDIGDLYDGDSDDGSDHKGGDDKQEEGDLVRNNKRHDDSLPPQGGHTKRMKHNQNDFFLDL